MQYGQKWRFFGEQKARYALFAIMGLFVFYNLLGHDISIHNAVRNGEADAVTLEELYFAGWTHDQLRAVDWANVAGMFVLVGYAVIIKIAQHKLTKISYNV